MRLLTLLLALCLPACATSFDVLEVNSLANEQPGTAQFDGLEALASRDPRGDVRRINILFMHGIGWIEREDIAPLANSFIHGVAGAYGLTVDEKAVSSLCGRRAENEDVERLNHILITSPETRSYRTTIPGRRLNVDNIVCMDRQVLPVGDDLEYVIYRTFWDDAMWNSLQFAHVGQDDALGEQNMPSSFARLRSALNRDLKDEFVNYGFSDAVLYLSAAGAEIRDAIRGAMCAAALDASGTPFHSLGAEVDYESVCARAAEKTLETDPFAFVTESLGSKIALDIVREAATDGVDDIHDAMIKQTSVFMLANQIPLLSLSDLSEQDAFSPSDYEPGERPTLIAFSEINDFLSYELIPFYEQLYTNSQIDPGVANADMAADDRRRLVDILGFNAIDMRVKFAGNLIPLVSFANPEFAHNGHVKQPEIMDMILCGADNAAPRLEGCQVRAGRR